MSSLERYDERLVQLAVKERQRDIEPDIRLIAGEILNRVKRNQTSSPVRESGIANINDAKDPRKIWHVVPERAEALEQGEILPPVSIELQPTMTCNLRCQWCSYWDRNKFDEGKGEAIPFEYIQRLAQYCTDHNVKGIYLSGGGEPCAYPHIADTVRAFKDVGCQLAMITNGTMFAKTLLDQADAFTYLQVSLISPHREQYQSVTGRDKHHQMMNLPQNIKNRWGTKSPTIGGMYVLTQWNYKSARDAIDFARTAGYDYCAFRTAIDFEDRGVSLPDEAFSWLREHFDEESPIDDTFTNLRSVLSRCRSTAEPVGKHCLSTSLGLYATVNARGEIYLCVPDVSKEGMAIGSMKDREFDEIWGGERHQDILKQLDERYACTQCHPACRSHAYNRAIANEMPDQLPNTHVELV